MQTLLASVPLTLGFDIIHHGARGLHDDITGPGAPSGVVDSPQREPGRGGGVGGIISREKLRPWLQPRCAGADLPLATLATFRVLAATTRVITCAAWSLSRLSGGSWAVT